MARRAPSGQGLALQGDNLPKSRLSRDRVAQESWIQCGSTSGTVGN